MRGNGVTKVKKGFKTVHAHKIVKIEDKKEQFFVLGEFISMAVWIQTHQRMAFVWCRA
jgi:hypothetical protein